MQVVKVDDVILHVLDSFDDVAQDPSIIRDLDSQSIFNCSHGADGVNRRSDPSYTLRNRPRFAGVAPFQDQLDASKHSARGPRIGYLTPIYLNLDPQVPLDTGNGINDNLCHFYLSFYLVTLFVLRKQVK
jgi:hypothetical protein